MCCPVKFAHSLPKNCRNTSNWELCVICQINTPDFLSCTTEKGRDTLFSAINKRQDDVYRRLYDEFNSLSLIPLHDIKYHRSCYKAYTSKRNWQRFVSDVPECSNTSNDAAVSTMKTRSKTLPQINWDYCIFCRQKSKFDYDLLSLLTVDDVQEKAQYHSACITNYLLKWKKTSADNYSTIKNESEHDIALIFFFRHFAPWPLWEQESVYYVFLVRQILFLASRGFIDKVYYCQITDKASKSLRRYYCDRKSKGTSSIKYSFQ